MNLLLLYLAFKHGAKNPVLTPRQIATIMGVTLLLFFIMRVAR